MKSVGVYPGPWATRENSVGVCEVRAVRCSVRGAMFRKKGSLVDMFTNVENH